MQTLRAVIGPQRQFTSVAILGWEIREENAGFMPEGRVMAVRRRTVRWSAFDEALLEEECFGIRQQTAFATAGGELVFDASFGTGALADKILLPLTCRQIRIQTLPSVQLPAPVQTQSQNRREAPATEWVVL